MHLSTSQESESLGMEEPSAILRETTEQNETASNTASRNNNDNNNTYSNDTSAHSERRETGCKDPFFLLLFFNCVGAVAAVANKYFIAFKNSNNKAYNYKDFNASVKQGLIFSLVFNGLAVIYVCCMSRYVINSILILLTICPAIISILLFVNGIGAWDLIPLACFILFFCYSSYVWHRIPFANVNVFTACKAIGGHWPAIFSTFLFTIAILPATIGWIWIWYIAVVGVLDVTNQCTYTTINADPDYGILVVLCLVMFFVEQVIQNSIHAFVAGMVGTWWFQKEDSCVGTFNSFIPTFTTSFGSICLGSCLVAPVWTMSSLMHSANKRCGPAIFSCIGECILSSFVSRFECFNKWAFIYVGLYGMPFMKAGKTVSNLFRNRGWEAVTADELVGTTLTLVQIIVAVTIGLFNSIKWAFDFTGNTCGAINANLDFGIGFMIGLIITRVFTSIINGAVNAVIVLFAKAPDEFQHNHPVLSQRMRKIWDEVYPGSINTGN